MNHWHRGWSWAHLFALSFVQYWSDELNNCLIMIFHDVVWSLATCCRFTFIRWWFFPVAKPKIRPNCRCLKACPHAALKVNWNAEFSYHFMQSKAAGTLIAAFPISENEYRNVLHASHQLLRTRGFTQTSVSWLDWFMEALTSIPATHE